MKTAKSKQSSCSVKDDNIGSNLRDSKTPHSGTTDNNRPAVETNRPSSKGQHSNASLMATAYLQNPLLWPQLRPNSDVHQD